MKKSIKKALLFLLLSALLISSASVVYAASTKVILCTGQTKQLKTSSKSKSIKWSTNKKSVATVSSTGKVKAIKKGNATVTAKVGSKKYTFAITVESPKMSKSSITIYKGKTYNLKMTGTSQKYKWWSKSSAIASVNTSTGKVTGKKTGTTYIYAKSASGKTFNCKVTVKNPTTTKSTANAVPTSSSITYQTAKTDNGEVIIFKNTNSYAVSVDVSCAFCRNGKVIAVRSEYDTVTIESGRKYAMLMWYNESTWDSVKITLSVKNNVSFFNFNASNIKYTSSRGSNGVILTVKNNGKTNWGTHMAVVYYKNGKIIGCDEVFADCKTKGSTAYVESRYPTDKSYNTIIPDKYEVYVNRSYSF